MNQPGPGPSVPKSLDECETSTSEICGTWTLQADHINAVWNNGAKATLNVEQFDNNGVVIARQDTVGSSAGQTARYEGRPIGNHVDGSVTWNWNGAPPGAEHGKLTGKPVNDQIAEGRSHWNPVAIGIF